MVSTLKVEQIRGLSSGDNPNKIIVPSGQTLDVSSATLIPSSGSVVQVQHYSNNTRTVLSAVASRALWTGITFNKRYANSKLILMGQLVFRDGQSYFMGEYWKVGASGNRYDGIVQHGYASDAGDASVQFGWTINAQYVTTEIGNLAVEIGWNTNGGGGNNPGTVWNPSSADDGRIQGTKTSTLTIMEVMN